jgi:hypothetical protein
MRFILFALTLAVSGQQIDWVKQVKNGPQRDVRQYGAKGDGTTDDTVAIQAALTAGGNILFPPGTYKVTSSLLVTSNTTVTGSGISDTTGAISTVHGTGNFPVFTGATTPANDVTIQNLNITGVSTSGSKGIYSAEANRWRIRDVMLDTFGDSCIELVTGVDGKFTSIFAQNCLLVRTGRTAYVGAVDIGPYDSVLTDIEATASVYDANTVGQDTYPGTGLYSTGWIAAIVVRGGNSFITNCIAQISQTGFVFSGIGLNRIVGNRADLNQGPGFVITSYQNTVTANSSFRNSRDSDNGYPGFTNTGGQTTFVGNITNHLSVDDGTAGHPRMSYGFIDSGSGLTAKDSGNGYWGNIATGVVSGRYSFSGSINKVVYDDTAVIAAAGAANGKQIPYATAEGGQTYSADFVWRTDYKRLGLGIALPEATFHGYGAIGSGNQIEFLAESEYPRFKTKDLNGGTNEKIWSMRPNTAGGAKQFLIEAISDNLGSTGTAIRITRNAHNIESVALGGKVQSIGTTFASLGTPSAGSYIWCSDCTVAATCSGSGTGAWAFRTGGATWTCPF